MLPPDLTHAAPIADRRGGLGEALAQGSYAARTATAVRFDRSDMLWRAFAAPDGHSLDSGIGVPAPSWHDLAIVLERPWGTARAKARHESGRLPSAARASSAGPTPLGAASR